MNVTKTPFTYIRLRSQEIDLWSLSNTMISPLSTNSDKLFLEANRPYWEYYFDKIDFIELQTRAILESTNDSSIKQILMRKLRSQSLFFRDHSTLSITQLLEDAKLFRILHISTMNFKKETNTPPVPLNNDRALTRPFFCKTIKVPEKMAHSEIEPVWRMIKSKISRKAPYVLLSMGWEKVVFAHRIKETFGSSVIDIDNTTPFDIQRSENYLSVCYDWVKFSLNRLKRV